MTSTQSHLQTPNPTSEQESIPIFKRLNGVFLLLIPIVIAAIAMCVQGSAVKSLLETHPTNTYVSIFAIIVFGFTFVGESQFSSIIGSIIGSFCLVALVFFIVPHWFAYTMFILWVFGFVSVAYYHGVVMRNTYNWLLQKSNMIYEKMSSLRRQRGPILPY